MIEDISQDHPDRMRIVIALNAGQCPDCGAYGFDLKPRVGMSRNIFCKACDQGFNISPDAPKVYFVQLAVGCAREPRLSRLARQRLPVLFRHPAEPVKLGDPGLHTDYDLEALGGGDQIARTGGSAERHFDIKQVGRRIDGQHVVDCRGDSGGVA
jgi:hypothetical protein